MLYGDVTNQLQYLVKTVQPPLVKVETSLTNVPKFEVGQQLPATVMASLPNGKFHVAVQDYGTLEMSLPPNTKKGDNVDLIVYQNSPKLTFILNSQNGKSTIPPEVEKQLYQNNPQLANSKASLSSAATTISQLLARQTQVLQNQQLIQNIVNRQPLTESKETQQSGHAKSSDSAHESKSSQSTKSSGLGSTAGADPFAKIQKQGDGYAQGEQDGSHHGGDQQSAQQGKATKHVGFQIKADQATQLSKGAEAAEHLHQADKSQNASQTQKANFVSQTQNLQQVNNPFTTGVTRLENFQQMIANNPLYRSAQIAKADKAILNQIPVAENTVKMAQQMQQTIERSGLFYESHLVDWVNDRRSLGDLLYEPQSQLVFEEDANLAHVATESSHEIGGQTAQTSPTNGQSKLSEILENVLMTAEEQYEAKVMEEFKNRPADPKIIHDEASSIVQQQLTLIDNPNQVHWQGQIWPGQDMSWAIKRDLPEGENDNTPEDSFHRQWRTEMRLTMENLGYIVGKVTYHEGRIKLEIHTKNEESAMLMKENMSILQDRLAIADIMVLDMKIIVHDK